MASYGATKTATLTMRGDGGRLARRDRHQRRQQLEQPQRGRRRAAATTTTAATTTAATAALGSAGWERHQRGAVDGRDRRRRRRGGRRRRCAVEDVLELLDEHRERRLGRARLLGGDRALKLDGRCAHRALRLEWRQPTQAQAQAAQGSVGGGEDRGGEDRGGGDRVERGVEGGVADAVAAAQRRGVQRAERAAAHEPIGVRSVPGWSDAVETVTWAGSGWKGTAPRRDPRC